MKILLHRGPGLIASAIRWQTDSRDWSHASLWFPERGLVIEAREFKGVVPTRVENLAKALEREPRLRIAVYDFDEPLSPAERAEAFRFARGEIGSPYDYVGVSRFVTRLRGASNEKWFCSEFATAVAAHGRRPLFRETEPHEVPPGLIPRSSVIHYAGEFPDYLAAA